MERDLKAAARFQIVFLLEVGGFAKRKNYQKCVRKKDEVGGLGLVLYKINLFPHLVNSGKFIVM